MSSSKSSTIESSPAQDSLFTRFIVAPVLFISFLVSLVIVDKKAHGGIFKDHEDKDGYYHSHQKKLAKEEMDEAFHMRKKVIAAMLFSGGIGVALTAWLISKGWHFVMKQ